MDPQWRWLISQGAFRVCTSIEILMWALTIASVLSLISYHCYRHICSGYCLCLTIDLGLTTDLLQPSTGSTMLRKLVLMAIGAKTVLAALWAKPKSSVGCFEFKPTFLHQLMHLGHRPCTHISNPSLLDCSLRDKPRLLFDHCSIQSEP